MRARYRALLLRDRKADLDAKSYTCWRASAGNTLPTCGLSGRCEMDGERTDVGPFGFHGEARCALERKRENRFPFLARYT